MALVGIDGAVIGVKLGVVGVGVVGLSFLQPEKTGDFGGDEGGVIAASDKKPEGADGKLVRRVHLIEARKSFLQDGELGWGGLEACAVIGASIVDQDGGDLVHETVAAVFFDIGSRSHEALLLAGPEHEADAAFGFDSRGHQDACGFEGCGGAGSVVGGACGAVPRVEMSAHDDKLIGFLASYDVRDDVEVGDGAFDEVVTDIEEYAWLLTVRNEFFQFLELVHPEGDLGDAWTMVPGDAEVSAGNQEPVSGGGDEAEDSLCLQVGFEFAGLGGKTAASTEAAKNPGSLPKLGVGLGFFEGFWEEDNWAFLASLGPG